MRTSAFPLYRDKCQGPQAKSEALHPHRTNSCHLGVQRKESFTVFLQCLAILFPSSHPSVFGHPISFIPSFIVWPSYFLHPILHCLAILYPSSHPSVFGHPISFIPSFIVWPSYILRPILHCLAILYPSSHPSVFGHPISFIV